jgi:branched-subunit amino acid ABC-type transport system permease component
VNPDTGFSMLLSIFAAVTLGGLESLLGSVIGAYIIAFSETLGVYYLSQLGISTAYRPAISFATLTLVLLVYPRGIAGLWSKR